MPISLRVLPSRMHRYLSRAHLMQLVRTLALHVTNLL